MVDVPSGSLIGAQLDSLKPAPGALTVAEPIKRKNGKRRKKKGKRPPPAESLYG